VHYYGDLYVSDFVTLKFYNKNKYKLTYHKMPVRQKGFEDAKKKKERITGVNTEKLDNNISRAKNKVFEYSFCNEFEYFVTLTIDAKKYSRDDLKTYYKDFGKFLNNYNSYNKTKVQYIFIPERHKDGNWHMHGLVKGILPKHLEVNEHGYLDWFHYRNKFGYISLDPIRNQEACSKYITKYVNKNLADSIKEVNAHMYYVSKGLNKAVEVKRGTLSDNSIPFDFENDYVKIKWFKNEETAISSFID